MTETQADELLAAHTQTNHGPTCLRYQAVRLYGTGYPVTVIQQIIGCGRTRLMEWCATHQTRGLEGVHAHRAGGNCRKLTRDQVADLTDTLHQDTPRSLFGPEAATADDGSLPDLRRAVQPWYGVTSQSDTSYRSLFRRCGCSYPHPARVFRSRRPQAVDDFTDQIENTWSTRCRMRPTRSSWPKMRRRGTCKRPRRRSGHRSVKHPRCGWMRAPR